MIIQKSKGIISKLSSRISRNNKTFYHWAILIIINLIRAIVTISRQTLPKWSKDLKNNLELISNLCSSDNPGIKLLKLMKLKRRAKIAIPLQI